MQTKKDMKAEQYLLRAAAIFEEIKHPFQFQIYENLIEFYFQQGMS